MAGHDIQRRALLASGASTAAVAIAGCTTPDSDAEEDSAPTGGTASTDDSTDHEPSVYGAGRYGAGHYR